SANLDPQTQQNWVGVKKITAIAHDNASPGPRSFSSAPVYILITNSTSTTVLARNDNFQILANAAATNLDVRANDTSTITTDLRIVQVVQSPHPIGSVEIAFDKRSIVYRPNRNAYGTDFLLYSVTDGVNPNSAFATVRMLSKPFVTL